MRLTYSVELSPRAWVPVALLEGRIASALGENLEAIRNYVKSEDTRSVVDRRTACIQILIMCTPVVLARLEALAVDARECAARSPS